jgi:WD40 repeat protein
MWPAEPEHVTDAGRLYELCSRLLYGPGTWFEACRDAVAGGAAGVADLVTRLAPGHEVARALATRATWPGQSRLRPPAAGTGPALSAAHAAADVARALAEPVPADERLRTAVAHWRWARVLPELPLTGGDIDTDLSTAPAAAATRKLAVLADDAPADRAAVGFVALLVRALSDAFPKTDRDVEVPVLFDRRATGGHGLLRISRMDTGPPGLFPDPRSMLFLVADSRFAEALDAAWRTAPRRLADRCVTWRLSTDGQPCDEVVGGSLGGAFGVGLAELARAAPPRLRPRRLDRRCAVSAALRPDGRLAEVGGARNKLEEAVRQRLRVVMAPPVDGDTVPDALLREASVRYAADLPAAVRLTRTRVNTTFAVIVAAVVLAASGVVGGAAYANREARNAHLRSIGTHLLADATTVRSSDPGGPLLLESLAVRLGAPGARAALARDLVTNRYAGTLPAPPDASPCGGPQTWSPDGNTVAVARQASVVLLDVRRRRVDRTIPAGGQVTGCAFAPDGAALAVAAGGQLSVFRLGGGPGATGAVAGSGAQQVQFAPNGLLATASDRDPVKLWSITPGQPPRLLATVPRATVRQDGSRRPLISFSPDSRTLAVGEPTRVTLVDVSRPSAPHIADSIPDYPGSVGFSPTGGVLAVGLGEGATALWDVPQHRRRLIQPRQQFGQVVGSVAFSRDGRELVTSGGGLGEVWHIDGDAAVFAHQLTTGPHEIGGADVAPGGDTAVVEDSGGQLTLWRLADMTTPVALATLPLGAATVSGVAFPAMGTPRLLVTAVGGAASLWDVNDPVHAREVGTVGPRNGRGSTAGGWSSDETKFSADSRRYALADDTGVGVWEVDGNGRIGRTGTVPVPAGRAVAPVALSPNGALLLVATGDLKQPRSLWRDPPSLWAVQGTPRLLRRLPEGTIAVTGTFAPDGRTLVTRADDGTTTWWNITKPADPVRIAQRAVRAEGSPGAPAFAPDGRLMVATEAGAPGALWDTADQSAPALLGTRPGLDGGSPGDAVFQGQALLLGVLGAIDVWDITEPPNTTRLTAFASGGTGPFLGRIAVSPTGVLAAVQLADVPVAYYTGENVVRLWDLAPILEVLADPVAFACRVTGAELSPELWRRYAPELSPRPICR